MTNLSDNDEDSGNDEPPYKESQVDVALHERAPNNVDDFVEENNEHHEESFDDAPNRRQNANIGITFDEKRPEPEPIRTLRHFLNELSEKQEIFPDIHKTKQPNTITNIINPKAKNTIAALPVEVLLKIFSYLDDISLSNISQVCKHWHSIVEAHTPQSMWQRYTRIRFPLYHQITRTNNWFKVYTYK